MKAQIRELLHAIPFRQFVIRMADGNKYLVEHPEFVLAATDTPQVVIEESNGRVRFLSVLQITSVETVPDAHESRAA